MNEEITTNQVTENQIRAALQDLVNQGHRLEFTRDDLPPAMSAAYFTLYRGPEQVADIRLVKGDVMFVRGPTTVADCLRAKDIPFYERTGPRAGC